MLAVFRFLLAPLLMVCLLWTLLWTHPAHAQNRPKAAGQATTAAAGPSAGPANPANPAGPAGNVSRGQALADSERCIECHGPEGQGAEHSNGPEGKFPKLAGQHTAYLIKQLQDFRSGARKHDVMGLMAKSVELAELRDIVAFFASRPRAAGDGSFDANGQQIYLHGDAARGIPACATCHGADAKGQASSGGGPVPALIGQEYIYLERQLLDWRSGWRRNSAGGAMNTAVQMLSEAEVRQVALYLSGLR